MQSPKNIDVLLAGVTFVVQGTPDRLVGEDALSDSQVVLCQSRRERGHTFDVMVT
jgi:hypothetical protein